MFQKREISVYLIRDLLLKNTCSEEFSGHEMSVGTQVYERINRLPENMQEKNSCLTKPIFSASPRLLYWKCIKLI